MSKTHLQQSQVSGSLSYSDSVERSDLFKANRTLADDLNSLRTQVKGILGEATWMDAQAIDLHNLKAQLTGTLVANNVDAAGTLDVDGAATLGSTLGVTGMATLDGGLTVNNAAADFNADVTANKISIDGDVAQRLYIVDADGSIKDEASLTFDGSELAITGGLSASGAADLGSTLDVAGAASLASTLNVTGAATLSSTLDVTGAANLSSTLDVVGAVGFDSTLDVAGAATLSDTLSVAGAATFNGAADFNADVTANKVSIDGDVAQRLYIVDADGSIKDEASLTFDGSMLAVAGSGSYTGTLEVDGLATFNNGISVTGGGLDISGDQLQVTGSFGVLGASELDGTLSVSGAATFNGAADFNAGITANEIKIDGDVAQRLYIVDADGSIKDEASLTFDGSELAITGGLSVSSAAAFNGAADFNADVTANKISIDGDVAQRLYIVDADGSIKDESKLTFDGSALAVDGGLDIGGSDFTVSAAGAVYAASTMDVDGAVDFGSTLNVAGAATLASTLDVAGAADFDSTLAVAGAATLSSTLDVIGAADLSSTLDVAGATSLASTLDVTGAASLSSTLSVAGNATFAANVTVVGDLAVQGAMTYIETENLKVKDAFIHLATGSTGGMSSGLVFHMGADPIDLVMGQKLGGGEMIFAQVDADANVDSDNAVALAGAQLAAAWMSSVKIGALEGAMSGSLAYAAGDIELSAENALKLVAHGNQEFSLAGSAEMAAFQAQYGVSTSLVGAILSAGNGGNFRKENFMGSSVVSDVLDFSSMGSLRAGYDAKVDIDVYLNGLLLAAGAGNDYTCPSADEVEFNYSVSSDDIITIVIRNAAL